VPGLGTSFGRGGATTFVQDLKNADCILIEGSNFAECHPVAFRFVMEAKLRGAKIIHVDPRFTRTSAMADVYAPIRTGSDITFLGGIASWLIENGRYFPEYVRSFTNASYLVREDFQDTEDLAGLFSGWSGKDGEVVREHTGMSHYGAGSREHTPAYDTETWGFELEDVPRADGTGTAKIPKRDETLQHPRCVLNVLRRHFSRYTPEMVERVCGTPKATFLQICELLASNSGRERTTSFAYAVGWTHHTVGVQYIRTAAIVQTLLGNMGRPGGGIMALRGHANIQGATDIATLYDLLPGYLNMPSALFDEQTLAAYLKKNTKAAGWWSNFPKYAVSLLKAWYGDAATAENDFCFDYLPQLTGDHSTFPTHIAMKDGKVEGYFVIGMNPSISGQNAELINASMERLKWMVVVDSYETETASFWKREGAKPENVGTEMYFIPAATILEKEGTMVNTNRMLQFHDKAVEPAGESITDAYLFHRLGRRLKEMYADSTDPKDRPILDMTWSYDHEDEHERTRGEPSVRKIMQEINGYRALPGIHPDDSPQVAGFADLKDDGSTASGGWIYSGVAPDKQTLKSRNRRGDDGTSLEWGFAWPANRRMLYNRASADADGKPWSERKKYVWWDEAAKKWDGVDVPDFPATKAPATPAQIGASGLDAHSGADPFIMGVDGRAQLFVTGGLKDGPLPTHYEPVESPIVNPLYEQQHNPTLKEWRRKDNPIARTVDPNFPHVLTTYRLTEQSGIMTRYVPWLAELQPELFCELDPELAVASGIVNGAWMTVLTPRGEVEAKALVSGRIRPLRVDGRRIHQIGLPYNWGTVGHAHGDVIGNLTPFVMDPNVSIHEAKSLACNVRAGRRAAYATATEAGDYVPPPGQRPQEGQPSMRGREGPPTSDVRVAGDA